MRAVMSAAPPAAKPTMMRTGRVGYGPEPAWNGGYAPHHRCVEAFWHGPGRQVGRAVASVNGWLYNLHHPPSCARKALAGGFGVRLSFSEKKPADKGARCARAKYTNGADHRTNLAADRGRWCADRAASSMIGRPNFGSGAQ